MTSLPLAAFLLEMGVVGTFFPPSPMFPLVLPLPSGLWRSPRVTPRAGYVGSRFISIVECVVCLWTFPFPSLMPRFFIGSLEGVLD